MVYNILSAVILLFCIAYKKNILTKMLFITICTCVLGFISACRYEIGYSDFQTNRVGFINIKSYKFSELIKLENPGNELLRKIISIFTDNPQWYFIITGFFIVCAFMIFIYRFSDDVSLSVIIFVCSGTYFSAHNITRQYIAIGIILFAFKYLFQRNFFKYFILVCIACTFHLSAIVMIAIYFLSKLKIKKGLTFLYLCAAILSPVIYEVIIKIFKFRYFDNYENGSYGTTGANVLNIILPMILLMYLFQYIKKKRTSLNKQIYAFDDTILHLGFCSFLLWCTAVMSMLIIARMDGYFCSAYLIAVPYVINSSKNKKLTYILTVTIFLGYFLINNALGRLNPTPYNFFWNIVG